VPIEDTQFLPFFYGSRRPILYTIDVLLLNIIDVRRRRMVEQRTCAYSIRDPLISDG
jgi:hypothetical protein